MGPVQIMLQDYIQTNKCLRTIFLSSVFTPCLGKKPVIENLGSLETSTCCTVKQRTCTALLEFLNPCSYSAAIVLVDECWNAGWVVGSLCCLLSISRRQGAGFKGKFQLSESTTCKLRVLEQFLGSGTGDAVTSAAALASRAWTAYFLFTNALFVWSLEGVQLQPSVLLKHLTCFSFLDICYIFSNINAADR